MGDMLYEKGSGWANNAPTPAPDITGVASRKEKIQWAPTNFSRTRATRVTNTNINHTTGKTQKEPKR